MILTAKADLKTHRRWSDGALAILVRDQPDEEPAHGKELNKHCNENRGPAEVSADLCRNHIGICNSQALATANARK